MTKAKSGLREMPATDYDHNKQNLQVHYIQQKCIINHMPASQNMVYFQNTPRFIVDYSAQISGFWI